MFTTLAALTALLAAFPAVAAWTALSLPFRPMRAPGDIAPP
jgi:hypothetical protein